MTLMLAECEVKLIEKNDFNLLLTTCKFFYLQVLKPLRHRVFFAKNCSTGNYNQIAGVLSAENNVYHICVVFSILGLGVYFCSGTVLYFYFRVLKCLIARNKHLRNVGATVKHFVM